MNKRVLGTATFIAGLSVGITAVVLNKKSRIMLKEKAIIVKENSSNFGELVKEKVTDIQSSVVSISKDIPKVFQKEDTVDIIPEQLDIQPEKEVVKGNVVEEELVEVGDLFTGNGEVLAN